MDNKLLVLMAAKACDVKKAQEIKLIKIDKVSYISEWILIAKGLSDVQVRSCLLYTSPSPRDLRLSRMPSSA